MAIDQPDLRRPSSAESVEWATTAVRRFARSLWLDLVRRDQSERWRNGLGVAAERYFELLPELKEDAEDALVVVCGEARCRGEIGQTISLAEYQARFPELAGELAIQFELDAAFGNLSSDLDQAVEREAKLFRLPGFEILQKVARGASGVIYQARQSSVGRIVAIKVMRAWSADEGQLSRHRQEASILSRMNHPNIVQIHDIIETEDALCTIIEFVDGPTLAEFAAGQPQVPHEAAALVRTLAQAVHCVHEEGVLHRDLKPSNVLLTSRGEPKITDFGLAKLLSSASQLTTHHCLLGTPSYMPPEQAAGQGNAADRQGDVYSLGAILYELLTGRPPFLGVTILDTLGMVRDRDPVAPHSLQPRTPRDLETICLKCLAKSPAERYQTAAELADDLTRFLSGAPILARRPAWRERALRWCRRNPAVSGLAACLLVTAVVGFLGVVWQWRLADVARGRESIARQEADNRALEIQQSLERLKLSNAQLERGQHEVVERHWMDADKAFSQAIELRPDLPQTWEARGELLYLRLGLWELAANDLARAFSLQKPSKFYRWWWNALLRFYTGDTAGYQKICSEMLDRDWMPGPYAFQLVRTVSLDPDNAYGGRRLLDVAQRITESDPNEGAHWYLQALVLLRAGRPAEAVECCQRSLQTPSRYVRSEVNYPILAIAHQALGQSDEARQALDRAQDILDEWTQLRCEPGPDAWIDSLGASAHWPVSCWDWLEFELYLREARGALGLDPNMKDPRWVLLRARSLAGLRRFEAADREYSEALRLLPADPQVQLETHRNRAYYHATRNEPAPAADEFAKASDLQPDDARLLGFEALMYLAADKVEAYRSSCREMIERFGDSTNGHVAHSIIDACVLHPQSLGDMGALEGIGRQAAKNYLGGVRMLGAAYYRMGEFTQAVSCFEESAKFRGLNSWDLSFLAMAHFRLGEVEAATRALEDADRWLKAANNPAPNDPTVDHPTWGGWYEKVQVPIVMREARALIRPGAAAGAP